MNGKQEKDINYIIQYFNRQVSNIFKIIDSKLDEIQDDNVDWVRRVTKIIRNENPPMMLEKSIDKLWDNKEKILERNTEFLLQTEVVGKYIKDDERKEFIEGLINFVRVKYKNLSKTETDDIWLCINNMLQAVIKYKIIKCDFIPD